MIPHNREQLFSPEQKIAKVEAIVREKPEVAGLQAYEYFRPANAAAEKEAFIKGEKEYPELIYPDLAPGKTDELGNYTELALLSMLPGEKSPKTIALFDAIEYRQAELFMLQMASRMHNEQLSEGERQEAQEWFKMTVEAVYGVPDKEVFSALADSFLLNQVRKKIPETHIKAKKLQHELALLLGHIDHSDYKPIKPAQETVTRLHDLIHERFDWYLNFIENDKEYDVDGILQACKTFLQKTEADKQGWSVEKAPNTAAFSTVAHEKRLKVGENKLPILGCVLKARLLHEAVIHAGCSINALNADWLAAAYGLDGCNVFEEALATSIEDIFHGIFKEHGVQYYVGSGLSYGQDNHEPRDFREVYEILWRTAALKTLRKAEDLTSERILKAKSIGYNRTMRLFGGTSGKVPGLIVTKNLAYYNGQGLAWPLLENVRTQEDLDLFFVGKSDLTRSDHSSVSISIAEKLGGKLFAKPELGTIRESNQA